jgi:hypothetical protein
VFCHSVTPLSWLRRVAMVHDKTFLVPHDTGGQKLSWL